MTLFEETPNSILIEPYYQSKTFLVRTDTLIIVAELDWIVAEGEPDDKDEQRTLSETLETFEKDEHRVLYLTGMLDSISITRIM